MTGIGVDLNGLSGVLETLDDLEDDWGDNPGEWIVGTGVYYSVYLEFGTSDINPYAYFRESILKVRNNLEDIVEPANSAEEAVARIAFRLEAEIKLAITRKGLVDTGTLRISVRALKGADPSKLPSADEIDPGNVDASETIQLDFEQFLKERS